MIPGGVGAALLAGTWGLLSLGCHHRAAETSATESAADDSNAADAPAPEPRTAEPVAPDDAFAPPEGAAPTPAELARRSAARDLYRRGTQALARREIDLALGHFQSCLERQADACLCHRGVGVVAAARADRQQAVQSFERYLELCPEQPDAPAIRNQVAILRGALASP